MENEEKLSYKETGFHLGFWLLFAVPIFYFMFQVLQIVANIEEEPYKLMSLIFFMWCVSKMVRWLDAPKIYYSKI
jgi:hypothetical protein